MNKYEVMYILNPEADDETITAQVERFNKIITDNSGEVEKVEPWGRRRLAYEIEDRNDGYYVLLYMNAPPELPKELERNFRIADEVMRYMVLRLDA